MYGISSLQRDSNSEKVRDCGPSERASFGLGWTSIIKPSAPAAIEALESGST